MTVLVLSPSEANSATEESADECGIIHPYGAWYFKIIFTLLTKIVVVHMEFFEIDLWSYSLKWMLLGLQLLLVPSLGLRCLHKHLHEFSEEVFIRERNKK